MRPLSFISGFASILGLFISLFCNRNTEITDWEWVFLGVFVISAIYFIYDWHIHKPLSYSQDDVKNIDKYMLKLISTPEPVFIFTQNMSWAASSPEIEDLLTRKAKKKELTICLPKLIDKAVHYKECGAKIIEFNYVEYTPQCRFTIVRYNRMSPKISVGRTVDERHTIEEYRDRDHPFFSLALDLVNILIKLDELRSQKMLQDKKREEQREKRRLSQMEKKEKSEAQKKGAATLRKMSKRYNS